MESGLWSTLLYRERYTHIALSLRRFAPSPVNLGLAQATKQSGANARASARRTDRAGCVCVHRVRELGRMRCSKDLCALHRMWRGNSGSAGRRRRERRHWRRPKRRQHRHRRARALGGKVAHTRGVAQRVEGMLCSGGAGRDSGEHDCARLADEGVAQHLVGYKARVRAGIRILPCLV